MGDGTVSEGSELTIAKHYRIAKVAVTSDLQSIRSLVSEAIGDLPPGSVIQFDIHADGDVIITDGVNDVELTIPDGETKIIPCVNAFDKVKMKVASTANILVELFMG